MSNSKLLSHESVRRAFGKFTAVTGILAYAAAANAAIVQVNGTATGAPNPTVTTVSSTDLINQGQATLASHSRSPVGLFGDNVNDGDGTLVSGSSTEFWFNAGLPVTLTYNLNTVVNAFGYDITSIQTLAGWSGATQSQANQDFELKVRTVGAGSFSSLGSFTHTPYPDTNGTNYNTSVSLTDSTGTIASGVEAVQFVYASASGGGSNPGLTLTEIDVEGSATAINQITPQSYVYDGTGAGSMPSTSPSFPDSGPNTELTDGLYPASTAFADAAWVGFLDNPDTGGSHPQITFDLDGLFALDEVIVTYLHSTTQAGGSITAPEEVLISTSEDGVSFSTPISFTAFDSSAGDEIRNAIFDLSGLTGRYARLDFRNTSPWTFLTEVRFTGNAVMPEPSSLVLVITGLMACLPCVRRRKRS